MSLYLGIKTGNYTTSAALFDSGKEVVLLVSLCHSKEREG